MIKLLPKSEIASLKAKEKSREIEEGVKIATRVDNLRALWSKTEQDFNVYKDSTLSAINKEINELTEEKQAIAGKLKQLKAEYDILLPEIPVKREELAKFEKKLFAWEKKLQKREEKSFLEELDVAEAIDAADKFRILNEDNERITANLLRQASREREEAKKTLDSARKIHNQVLQEKKEIESSLDLREQTIKAKEQELSNKELSIMNFQEELEKEKAQVKDQRETLERSLARLREGRRA